jgi:DnaJ-domain-containing protein 1
VARLILLIVLALIVWRIVRHLVPRPSERASESRGNPAADGPRDPYAVLGITAGASRAEITHAYRDQMKRYHPDRVADLGPELQQTAHRMTLEIQRAYDVLTRD